MIAIDWKPDAAALRKFGRSMLWFGLIFTLWFWYKGAGRTAWVVAGTGVFCFITSLVCPALNRWVYLLWMLLTWLLSQIITPVVMMVFYYLILTPIGILLKFFGHDRLGLKKPANTDSYWVNSRSTAGADYERQF